LEIALPQFEEIRATLISFSPEGKPPNLGIGVASRKEPGGSFYLP